MSSEREDVVTLAEGTDAEVRVFVVVEQGCARLLVLPMGGERENAIGVMPITRAELLALRAKVNRAIDMLGAQR